jgi:hypothetical protein
MVNLKDLKRYEIDYPSTNMERVDADGEWVKFDDINEFLQASANAIGPKLFDEMERFAVLCDRAGNGKDARLVRSWVKQLQCIDLCVGRETETDLLMPCPMCERTACVCKSMGTP